MRRIAAPTLTVFAMACLLAALSLVTWRQTRALDALRSLDEVRRQRELVQSEQTDLVRRIQVLESRGSIVPAARQRLGMHTPGASEIVYLPGESR